MLVMVIFVIFLVASTNCASINQQAKEVAKQGQQQMSKILPVQEAKRQEAKNKKDDTFSVEDIDTRLLRMPLLV